MDRNRIITFGWSRMVLGIRTFWVRGTRRIVYISTRKRVMELVREKLWLSTIKSRSIVRNGMKYSVRAAINYRSTKISLTLATTSSDRSLTNCPSMITRRPFFPLNPTLLSPPITAKASSSPSITFRTVSTCQPFPAKETPLCCTISRLMNISRDSFTIIIYCSVLLAINLLLRCPYALILSIKVSLLYARGKYLRILVRSLLRGSRSNSMKLRMPFIWDSCMALLTPISIPTTNTW